MKGIHAIPICLIHGVAVWPDDQGGLSVLPLFDQLSLRGVDFLKRNKREMISAFKEYKISEIMKVFFEGYGPRLKREILDEAKARFEEIRAARPATLKDTMTAWAYTLYADNLRGIWPRD